jgi:type I restriction enzyme, S subunit
VNARLATIGDFVEPVATWNPAKKPATTFRYVDLGAVDQIDKEIKSAALVRGSEAPSRARQLIKKDDILVSTVRPNLNCVAAVTGEFNGATASTGFCVLRPCREKLSSSYLFHWVRSSQFVDVMVRQATGASYPAVSDRIIKGSLIPLPPLDEQQRIAAILDKADAVRRKRKRALRLLEGAAQSIFLELFGDPVSNPMNWPLTSVGEIASKIGSGATPAGGDAAYKKSGISLVRSMNVRDEGFTRKGLAYIDEMQAAKLANVSLEAEDVLLNITGASVARVCLCPPEILPGRVNQHVSIIRPANKGLNAYVAEALRMPTMKMKLLGVSEAGATRQAITKSQIEQIVLPLPAKEILSRFRAATRNYQELSRKVRLQAHSMDALFASLQNQAFIGRL